MGVKRVMEGSESQRGAERPGKVEERQGGLKRVIECWRGPGSVIEGHGVWNRPVSI